MVNMPREGKPREVQVMLRLTEEGAGVLDDLRGTRSRQDYLRDLIRADYKAKLNGRARVVTP